MHLELFDFGECVCNTSPEQLRHLKIKTFTISSFVGCWGEFKLSKKFQEEICDIERNREIEKRQTFDHFVNRPLHFHCICIYNI